MSSPLNVLIFWYIGTVTRLLSVFSLSSQSGISTGNNGQLHTSLSHSPQDNSNSMLPSFPRQHASALMIHNKMSFQLPLWVLFEHLHPRVQSCGAQGSSPRHPGQISYCSQVFTANMARMTEKDHIWQMCLR